MTPNEVRSHFEENYGIVLHLLSEMWIEVQKEVWPDIDAIATEYLGRTSLQQVRRAVLQFDRLLSDEAVQAFQCAGNRYSLARALRLGRTFNLEDIPEIRAALVRAHPPLPGWP